MQLDVERGEKIAPEVLDAIAGTQLDTGRIPGRGQEAAEARAGRLCPNERLAEPVQPRPQGGIGGRYAASQHGAGWSAFRALLEGSQLVR